jgi:hypothetical protein
VVTSWIPNNHLDYLTSWMETYIWSSRIIKIIMQFIKIPYGLRIQRTSGIWTLFAQEDEWN